MPETTNYTFELRELTELLIKAAGVREGLWMLSVNLNFTAGNFQTAPETALPGSLVAIQNVAISRTDAESSPPNLTVDASKVTAKAKR